MTGELDVLHQKILDSTKLSNLDGTQNALLAHFMAWNDPRLAFR